jgi:hypothetical protein
MCFYIKSEKISFPFRRNAGARLDGFTSALGKVDQDPELRPPLVLSPPSVHFPLPRIEPLATVEPFPNWRPGGGRAWGCGDSWAPLRSHPPPPSRRRPRPLPRKPLFIVNGTYRCDVIRDVTHVLTKFAHKIMKPNWNLKLNWHTIFLWNISKWRQQWRQQFHFSVKMFHNIFHVSI